MYYSIWPFLSAVVVAAGGAVPHGASAPQLLAAAHPPAHEAARASPEWNQDYCWTSKET